ncbi:MAG TPA: Smr/MutS family protein [Thermoanaerobaculia bacterium]|nr:Smr/MutS family protein [Thermoanaerobaculia bacterium]
MQQTLSSLEFDRVLTLIALEAKTSLGRDTIARRRPATTLEACERLQAELFEMLGFHLREGGIPLGGLSDVRFVAEADRLLELHESWQVLRAVEATQALRETFVRASGSHPLLAQTAAKISDLSSLVSTVSRYFTRDGKLREEASAELRSIRSRMQAKRSAIQKMLVELMSRHAEAIQDPLITIRGERYCIPVRTDHRSTLPGILHERSGSGASLFIEPMQVVESNNDLAELLLAERDEIARITRRISQALTGAAGEIVESIEIAGELDGLQACAIIASDLGATRPRFTSGRKLTLFGARHPLLDERLSELRRRAFDETPGGVPVVQVTIRLDETTPALLITGPNAGGKTVALKTAGLLVAMAMAGLPVPAADGTVIPIVDALHVLIGDDQSVLEHLSTFTAYLTRLKAILHGTTPRSLILLDELGSGTDPEEGSALAASVVEHVLSIGSLLIVTTHLSALKTFAVSDERIANAGMEFDPETGRPTFRLIAGVPGRSRAIEVAEMIGLPGSIVERARERLGLRYGEFDNLLAALQQKMADAAAEADALATERREAGSIREALRREREAIEAERKGLSRTVREEIDRLKDEVARRVQSELRHLRELDRSARERINARELVANVVGEIDRRVTPEDVDRPLVVGDEVEHRRLKLRGRVAAIDGMRVQLDVGGKTVRAELGDLVSVAGEKPRREKAAARGREKGPASSDAVEISAELSLIGRRVEEALDEADRFIDRSLLEGRSAIRLIHGFGTGALRKALREYLRTHRGVRSFRPGEQNEGGDGATVVVLDI